MAKDPQPEDDIDRIALRKGEATAKGGHAFHRLLQLAERHDSGQVRRVARFIASTYNGQAFPFDLCELRPVDEAIGDDMLLCIDAMHWGQADLHTLIPDGDQPARAVLEEWGIVWPEGPDRAASPHDPPDRSPSHPRNLQAS